MSEDSFQNGHPTQKLIDSFQSSLLLPQRSGGTRAFIVRSMSQAPQPAAVARRCASCGRDKDCEGRSFGGRWACNPCRSIQQQLYRNIGASGLAELDEEQKGDFFRACQDSIGNGRYQWMTVRAALVKSLCHQRIKSYEKTKTTEELPLSVWISRGWEESVIKKCPTKTDDTLGELFCVPVTLVQERGIFRVIEKELLEKEKHAREKKTKKGIEQTTEPAWDVGKETPAAGAHAGGKAMPKGKAAAKADPAKAAKALEIKTEKNNKATAALAAKSVSLLSGAARSVTNVLAQANKHLPDLDPQQKQELREAEESLGKRVKACSEVLGLVDRVQGAPLPSLSFSFQDCKDAVKAAKELADEVRKAIRAAKDEKAQAEDDLAEAKAKDKPQPPAKRIRKTGKQQEA